MQEFDFQQPTSLSELVAILDDTGGRVIAGGTDVIPRMRHDLFSAATLVDASRVAELNFLEKRDDEIAIGALTTHDQVMRSDLLMAANPALVQAAASVGCNQTRQRGTLGGNLANASPAADCVPPLSVFNARLRLLAKDGERILPLADFFSGPGKTQLKSTEIIHSILFKPLDGAWGAAFQKMGKRSGMAIAVVSAAAALTLDETGTITDARIALGSVAPTVVRSPKAEAMLKGQQPTPTSIKEAAQACSADISPISDVRSSAEYRGHAATVLVERAIQQALDQARRKLA